MVMVQLWLTVWGLRRAIPNSDSLGCKRSSRRMFELQNTGAELKTELVTWYNSWSCVLYVTQLWCNRHWIIPCYVSTNNHARLGSVQVMYSFCCAFDNVESLLPRKRCLTLLCDIRHLWSLNHPTFEVPSSKRVKSTTLQAMYCWNAGYMWKAMHN